VIGSTFGALASAYFLVLISPLIMSGNTDNNRQIFIPLNIARGEILLKLPASEENL